MDDLFKKIANSLIAGKQDEVKKLTQDFVDKIGADAYGANAASAVEKAKELI